MGAAFEVVESGLIRVDVADQGTAFDAHVAHGHALFHVHTVDDLAAVFVGEAFAAADAQLPDDMQDHVFGINAGAESAVDVDAAHFQFVHRQRLSRQHIAHLAGADAES